MTQQLSFDLPNHVRLGAEDFFVSDANAQAYGMLQNPAAWPDGKLALVGARGSGKSHLVRIFAASSGAAVIAARDVIQGMPLPDRSFVLEDGETLPAQAQEWLFHAHNKALRSAHYILLTSHLPPARWPLTLPDLRSRLQATTTAQIENPDDALLTAVLLKHFADRQLAPAPDALAYLVKHLPRSFAALRDVVVRLDHAALAQSKPLSRPFVRAVLDSMPPMGDGA